MRTKSWMFLIICFLLLASCNLPVAKETPIAKETPVATTNPEKPGVDAMGTAVELTTIAKLTALAGPAVATATNTPAGAPPTETPSPTPCTPLVTAATTANIRSGPGTAYDVVGTLPVGGTAKLAGRNDVNTWWYIEFVGGVGGHAWVAGTVTTASCVPTTVQIVAAPVLPTAQPQANTDTSGSSSSSGGTPDLIASGMQWSSNPKKGQPVSIQVKVRNNGNAPAGEFTVAWLSNQTKPGCSWTLPGLAANTTTELECEFTYDGNATATYWVTLKVDTGNQVAESNEDNNSRDAQLYVKP